MKSPPGILFVECAARNASRLVAASYPSTVTLAILFVFYASAGALTLASAAVQPLAGTIEGRIYNPVSGEYVRNAEVRVEGTSILVFSGADGTYRISNAPAGAITLSVSYAGYRTSTGAIAIAPGQSVTHNFELSDTVSGTGDVVQMSRMTVASGIEGNAKAMMEQRAAMNVKNVVASDAFGELSEGNIGELLQYMPGIQIEYDQSDMTGARMGGMATKYGALLVDGVRVTSTTGSGRGPGFTAINARSADMVELNKTASADMDADAPAGTINLASKSAFQRRGREVAWRFYATANSEQLTLKRVGGPSDAKHYQVHPSGSIEFSDSFLGNRLGVIASFDMTHVNHQRHHLRLTYNTAPTAINADPIVLTQIQYADGPKSNLANRGNLGLDYKLTSRITLSLRGQIADRDIRIYDRNFSLITARNNLAPGSTASFQVANAAGNATRLQWSGGYQERTDTSHSYSPKIVYAGDRLQVDAALAYSKVHIIYRNAEPDGSGVGPPTGHSVSLYPISWRMQRGGPGETGWTFQQLSGPDMYNLGNWDATFPTNSLSRSGALRQPTRKKYIAQANARFDSKWRRPTFFKGGFKIQEEIYTIQRQTYSWSYIGPNELALIPTSVRFDPQLGGNLFTDRTIPWPDRRVMGKLLDTHPEYFVRNPADFTNVDNLYPNRYAKEQIDAAYLMGNTQWGPLILQGGGRYEHTRTAARIYERNQLRTRFGDYDNVFWSGAAKYRFRENLMAIVSYNQSILRPDFGNMTGVLTVNDETMVGNIPNPNLRPEYGENYFARMEYYLKSAGVLSVGVFKRYITDLHFQRGQIPAEDLGLEGDYPGYVFTSWGNASTYESQGYELEYNQQLSMLPGILRGLGVFASYTRVSNSDAALSYGNSPSVGSGGLSFRYRGLMASIRGSWNDRVTTSATEYRKERTVVGLSASYRLPRNMSVFFSGTNITKSPIANYRSDRPGYLVAHGEFGSNWTMGLEGRF
jgi:TonB-dependent receptor